MAYSQPPDAGEMRATLALSQAESQTGSSRTLNLPGGRRITVSIPPGVYNGQELRVAGQGEPTWQGGPAGDLILTISIAPEPVATQYNQGVNEFAPTEAYSAQSFPQTPPPPPGYSPAPAGELSPYTAYPPQPAYNAPAPPIGATQPAFNTPQQPQDPLYLPQNQAVYQPPAYPGSPGYTQPGQVGGQSYPPPAPRKRRLSPAILTLIVILVLLLLAGSGLIYYVGVYQPKVQHDQATATALARLSATANAQSSATALANATANAIASATANAQATATAQASATAAALQTILTTATSGTPLLNDTLNAQSSTSNWDILAPANSSVGGSCQFANGAYHSNMPTKGYFQPCYASTPIFTNFAFQVQMTITQGDEGGILFRANPNNSTYYLFRIDTNGAYDLFVYSSNQASSAKRLLNGTAQGFKTGPNQPNILALVAQGNNLYFYANGQYIDSASDSTFTSGKIGVFGEDATNPTDAAFTNAQVWQL